MKPRKAEAAIVISKDNEILCQGFGHEKFLFESLRAHYRFFWEAGIAVDFVSAKEMEKILDYRVITLPFLLTGSRHFFQVIEEYVRQGGIVYGEPRLSFLDEKGWYHKECPVGELQNVFGMESLEIEKRETIRTLGNCAGYWHREKIRLKGAEILDSYADGEAAMIIHSRGKGKAVYGTSHFMLGNLQDTESVFQKRFLKILKKEGIRSNFILNYKRKEGHVLEGQILEDSGRIVFFLESYLKEETEEEDFFAEIMVDVSCEIRQIKELFSEKILKYSQSDRTVCFMWNMKERDSCIFELLKQV